MNNPTSNKKSSKPSKSFKQSHRVEAQLARRKKATSEVVPATATDPASAIELIPGSILPLVEKVHFAEAEKILTTRKNSGRKLVFSDPINHGFSIAIDDFSYGRWGQ